MAITARSVNRTPVLRAHATRIRQGNRDVYHFALRIAQFDDALPVEVDEKVIKDNRRFIPSHAKTIQDYLSETKSWVLGPVTLSIDPQYVEFEPYPGQGKNQLPEIGELRIVEGASSSLRIIDGQHRRRAIRDFRRSPDAVDSPLLAAFERSQMPVALYTETDTQAIHQMFADMAQQRSMTAVARARFDQRDPFNRAADEVRLQSVWLDQFVEMDSSTVSRGSNKLIAFNQLSVNLKTLLHGYGGRVSRIRQQEANRDFDDLVDLGLYWVDEFLPSAREEYAILPNLEADPDFIPDQRRKTFAYSGTMLRIIAGCFYEWRTRNFPGVDLKDVSFKPLEEYLRAMDFKTQQRQTLLHSSGVIDNEGYTLRGGRREIGFAINSIVEGASAKDATQAGT